MQRIVIIGAGGHGQVVADILLCMAETGARVCPIGYLDDRAQNQGEHFLGLPVLGPLAMITESTADAAIVAIGDNAARRRISENLRSAGIALVSAIHPSAVISRDVQIGTGSMICAGAIIHPGCRIGDGVILNTGCSVDHHSRIADYVHLAPGVHTGGEVVVERGVFVGLNSGIMPRKHIGEWSVIGAGSLVQRDVPPAVVAYGVPARVQRSVEPPAE